MRKELKDVKEKVLRVGWLVETAISNAVDALLNRDQLLAEAVVSSEAQIDRLEVDVEQMCFTLLKHRHLLPSDIGLLLAAIKIDNDLERMGDLAENIAVVAINLCDFHRFELFRGCKEMADNTVAMVRESLSAFVNCDTRLSRKVLRDDDCVDRLASDLTSKVIGAIESSAEHAKPGVHWLHAIRQLERIADLSTNIAEEVIFMVEGKVVRHRLIDGKLIREAV